MSSTHLRIVIISDTHGLESKMPCIPKGDVLLHSGDFSSQGDLKQLVAFKEFMNKQLHQHKVFIAGNHDMSLHTGFFEHPENVDHRRYKKNFSNFTPTAYSEHCIAQIDEPGSIYLMDESYVIDVSKQVPVTSSEENSEEHIVAGNNNTSQEETRITIYGSPWQPEFCNWAFNLNRGPELAEKWKQIPDDSDIVMTHGPCYGILDANDDGEFCGCEELLKVIKERVKPRLHVFGHIHEGYGTYFDDTTLFVNGSTCNGAYKPDNRPIVIDLPFDKSLPAVVVPYENQVFNSPEEEIATRRNALFEGNQCK